MSRVRNKDTDIERIVRSRLHREGLRFRKNVRSLPGSPDIVFPGARVAVFVDGDFWHGYRFEAWRDGLSPFWEAKIQANRDRDARNRRSLKNEGWHVVRLWQHEIRERPEQAIARVRDAVAARKGRSVEFDRGLTS